MHIPTSHRPTCDDGNPCAKTDQCRADKTCAGVIQCDTPGFCETTVGSL